MAITYHAGRRIQGLDSEKTYLSASNTYDSNATSTNTVTSLGGGSSPYNTRIGLEVTTGHNFIGKYLQSITFKMDRYGSVSGAIYCKIYSTSNSLKGTSVESVEASNLPSYPNSTTPYTYTFATPILIASGDKIVIEGSNASGNDQVDIYGQTSDVDNYTQLTLYNNGSWANISTSDIHYVDATLYDSITTNVQSGTRFEATDTRKIYYGAIPLTFEDDFTSSGATSHTANNTTVGGWTTSDYLECKVNGSNDNMDISLGETATNDSITYDLGSNASSNWILRFEFDFSTLTESVENIAWVGLSSVDYSNTSTTTQNFTGMQFEYTGSQHMIKLHDTTSSSLHIAVDTTGADLTTNWNTTDKMYVELIKNGTSYTRKVSTGGYVGDGGTEIVASITGTTGDHADLRYITFRNRNASSRAGTIDGTVDNLKWYNGATSTDFTWTEET